MDLSEFVERTILQLVRGVRSAGASRGDEVVTVPAIEHYKESLQDIALRPEVHAERFEFDGARLVLLGPQDLAQIIRLSATLAEAVVESLLARLAPAEKMQCELLAPLSPVIGSVRGLARPVSLASSEPRSRGGSNGF